MTDTQTIDTVVNNLPAALFWGGVAIYLGRIAIREIRDGLRRQRDETLYIGNPPGKDYVPMIRFNPGDDYRL